MATKGIDYLKPMTPLWDARQRRHRHNGFTGSAKMMQMNAISIINSDTTTTEAKKLASQIHALAALLAEALKQRVDQ